MIDYLSEHVITFAQACDELPRRRRGRKTDVSTIYRWTTYGCRGVVLETVQIGGSKCTSREALARFFVQLSGQRPSGTVGDDQAAPIARARSTTQRRRASEAAARRLVEMGA